MSAKEVLKKYESDINGNDDVKVCISDQRPLQFDLFASTPMNAKRLTKIGFWHALLSFNLQFGFW